MVGFDWKKLDGKAVVEQRKEVAHAMEPFANAVTRSGHITFLQQDMKIDQFLGASDPVHGEFRKGVADHFGIPAVTDAATQGQSIANLVDFVLANRPQRSA